MPSAPISPSTLARARHKGFDRLIEQYWRSVFVTVYGFVRNIEDANDLTQETFFCAYRYYDRFRGECSELTWLCRIARNRCIDHQRRQTHRQAHAHVSLERSLRSREVADHRPTPQGALERQEREERLRAAIASLSPAYRELFHLREFDDLSYSEIVAVTGLSLSNVKVRLSRARAMLRTQLTASDSDRQ